MQSVNPSSGTRDAPGSAVGSTHRSSLDTAAARRRFLERGTDLGHGQAGLPSGRCRLRDSGADQGRRSAGAGPSCLTGSVASIQRVRLENSIRPSPCLWRLPIADRRRQEFSRVQLAVLGTCRAGSRPCVPSAPGPAHGRSWWPRRAHHHFTILRRRPRGGDGGGSRAACRCR